MAAKTAITAPRSLGNRIGFWLGIVVFFLIYFIGNLSPDNVLVSRMAAVAALMAIWWISDAIPLAATSLLPLVLFPLSGIMKGKDVAPVYMNYIIFLFIGGFLIALAMERWDLHKRIALSIIRLAGSQPSRLVLGFMLATAFLSMWISNTATTIMMLAIGLAVIKQAEDSYGADKTKNLGVALLLGIAYSASIGGVSTLVGTPPNRARLHSSFERGSLCTR
ncbi:MAG: SLC13 family permease [Verrucomicrobiales bacterium]